MKKVLITGISGNSGKYFQEVLLEKPLDIELRLLVRSTSSREGVNRLASACKAEIIEGDLSDPTSLEVMTRDIDTIFHIAGIGKSLELCKAGIKNGVKRFVLVHTTGIYSKYKAAGEEYRRIEAAIRELIADKDISLIILRPTMIYGSLNDQNMIKFIRMADSFRVFPMVKGGHFALQPVHQQDLGRAYYQILQKLLDEPEPFGRDKEYILSGGTVIDLIDMLKLMNEYLGNKTTYFSVPFWFAYSGAWALYILTLGHKDYREKVQRLVEPRAYPHEEATADFGYAPMPYAEGLKREIELYKEAKNV